MQDLYDIYFKGEVLEGHDPAAVRNELGRLFKASEAVLDRLFSGEDQLIKKACDNVTALKYQKAMKAAGARPLIRPAGEDNGAVSPGPETAAESASQGEPPSGDSGPDGDFDLADAGSRLSEPAPEPPPPPDTGHLSAAAPGEDIPNLPRFEQALAPDTSGIELAPEGTDLTDCAPPPSPELNPDLSHLELAEAGADLLEETYRQGRTAEAPDTDHLQLEPPG